MVAVYSGTNDLLSPLVGVDPMHAGFAIQGYETEIGSHAQFLTVQAPQVHAPPPDLTLEQAGSYILNLGTVWRCLFTTLRIAPGRTLFVEGASTGTGLDALRSAVRTGLQVTGLVSSEARAQAIARQGAVGALDRKDAHFADLFTTVPEEPAAAREWEAAGAPLVAEYERLNGGKRGRLCRQPRRRDRLSPQLPAPRRGRRAGLLRGVVGLPFQASWASRARRRPSRCWRARACAAARRCCSTTGPARPS